MDTIETLKQDVREGRISAERLVDLVVDLSRKLEAANQRNEALNRRIEALEKQCGGAATAKVEEPFSTRAEEQRQEARGKKRRKHKPKGRRGRVSTADKVALVGADFLARTGKLTTIDETFALLSKVTIADVKRVAAKYFAPQNRTVVVLEPGET